MAAAVTSSNKAVSSGSVSSLTLSYVSDGNPLLVLVAINSSTGAVKTVTFNGTNLSRISPNAAGSPTHAGGSWEFEVWGLQAPGATTANIVVTPTASNPLEFGAYNVSGMFNISDLTPDLLTTAFGTSAAPTVTGASRTGDLVLGFVANATTSQTFTDGGSQSNLFSSTAANTNPHCSSSTKAGASSVTMSWTLGTSGAWGIATFNLPTSGTTSSTRISQVAQEVVTSGKHEARLSQLAPEFINSGKKEIRTSQVAVEFLTPNSVSPERVSQLALEFMGPGSKTLRVSQVAIEFITKNVRASPFPPHCIMM